MTNPNQPSNGSGSQGDTRGQGPSSDGATNLVFLLMLAGSIWMIVQGVLIFRASSFHDGTLLGLGILAVILTASLYILAGSLSKIANRPASSGTQSLDSLREALMLSDTAKRILYRERDRQALRKAIREDIDKRDYEAALTLVSQMGQVYGYRLESEQFRSEIEAARAAEQEKKIDDAIRSIDLMISRHEFDKAILEAGRIERVYAESDRVQNLRKRVRDSRDRYKHELERKFLEAAGRDDIEVGMELMKELDKYLTEGEAAPFLETARGVIGKKRQNLGVQFKLAVHDKEWTAAVRVGEQIIREFPNSKMGEEVRGMLDVLRQRAGEQVAALSRQPA